MDTSFEEKALSKRFISKWLPGDYIAGFGLEPTMEDEVFEDEDGEDADVNADVAEEKNDKAAAEAFDAHAKESQDLLAKLEAEKLADEREDNGEDENDDEDEEEDEEEDAEDEEEDKGDGKGGSDSGGAKADGDINEATAKPTPTESIRKSVKMRVLNESFSDNPMYPIAVNEPALLCVSLYQRDR